MRAVPLLVLALTLAASVCVTVLVAGCGSPSPPSVGDQASGLSCDPAGQAFTAPKAQESAARVVNLMPALVRQGWSAVAHRPVAVVGVPRSFLPTNARRQPSWSVAPILAAESLTRAAGPASHFMGNSALLGARRLLKAKPCGAARTSSPRERAVGRSPAAFCLGWPFSGRRADGANGGPGASPRRLSMAGTGVTRRHPLDARA